MLNTLECGGESAAFPSSHQFATIREMTSEPHIAQWHHAPPHRFIPNATYFITAGKHWKEHVFNTPAKLDHLQSAIFAEDYRWCSIR
jgi:hypothetical protein